MKKTNYRIAWLSAVLCVVLIAVMALNFTGCASVEDADSTVFTTTTAGQAVTTPTRLGQGEITFTFEAVDKDGQKTVFEISTDKETVGAALLELNLIDGENSTYGLYVKTVNGVTLDYDTDKMYWAFYANGEYSMAGVDSVTPVSGAVYMFRAEK